MMIKKCILAFLLSAVSSVIAADDDHEDHESRTLTGGKTIELELGARPEGITNGKKSTLYVSQILSGSVEAFNAKNGKSLGKVVPDQTGRQAWGLWYYKRAIFVAGGGPSFGGGTAEVYVYDAHTGESLATCSPDSTNPNGFDSFLNDVTVRDGKAYITDSFSNELMVLDARKAIRGTCDVSSLTLPDAFIPENADDFGANGIVEYAGGLLVADELGGSIWYLNLKKGTSKIIIQETPFSDFADPYSGPDGLVVCGNKLYVVFNAMDEIGVYSLSCGKHVKAKKRIGTIDWDLFPPGLTTPATAAIYKDYIYATNSRFFDYPEISDVPPEGESAVGKPIPRDLRCPKGGKSGKSGKSGKKH